MEDLARVVVSGGWPGNIDRPEAHPGRLARSYVESFLSEDMHKVDEVKRSSDVMARLLRSLARNAEQPATPKSRIRDASGDAEGRLLSADTVEDYLRVVESCFIVEEVAPWVPNARSPLRINKKPKYHFIDPSLPAAILRLTPQRLLSDFETFGFLFESLCTRDLSVYAEVNGGSVYYYRDRDGLEVDEIVEAQNGSWAAIEVKLGHNQADAAASNLLKPRAKLTAAGAPEPSFLAVIEGLGDYAYTRPDGVFVIPIATLGV